MSLRSRLTLLYTSLLGGVLLIFGMLVYGLVSLILMSQVDDRLEESGRQVLSQLTVSSINQIDIRQLASFQTPANLIIQVWSADGLLRLARPASQIEPLDRLAQASGKVIFTTSGFVGGDRLRVLTIPLRTERGPVGTLQIALNINLVDNTRRALGSVVILLTITAMLASALAAGLIIDRALEPLASVTAIATQITRASDLQRRLPVGDLAEDEIGELVLAFNETLERLEVLFTTQQRFMADVSHDLRTPLTVIKGNAGLLRKMKQIDQELLLEIEREVDRLTRMVEELLLLAQVESGNLPMDMKPVELDTVLLEVIRQMKSLAGEAQGLQITEIDQAQVMGDEDRLKQVFLNIIGNSLQHTPPGTQIKVALRLSGRQAQISVSDNGPGIPQEDIPHLFERFYRGEKSRKRRGGSSFGLGLSIAYWIVRGHGGAIEVQSIEGKGSTFTVWLPLLESKK